MSASKLQANWTAVTFASTAIGRCDSVTFAQGGSVAAYSSGVDRFPTQIVNLMNKPTASVTGADVAVLMGIAPGATGTFTATLKDANNATGGDIVFAMINSVVVNPNMSGGHGAFATSTLDLQAYSTDGTTNPLSFTRA